MKCRFETTERSNLEGLDFNFVFIRTGLVSCVSRLPPVTVFPCNFTTHTERAVTVP
jgi:hypothetical protein